MQQSVIMKGSRLEFVVVPIEQKVKRPVHRLVKGEGIKETIREEPGGFLVYFPRGHVIRIRTQDELKHYGLNRKARIINLTGLNDPNSPVGRLLNAQDEGEREEAMQSMEQMVMQLATAASGPVQMPEQVRRTEVPAKSAVA